MSKLSAQSAMARRLLFTAIPTSEQAQLITDIKGHNWQWIEQADLAEVAIRLLALRVHDTIPLNGEALGLLAKRLIACEIQPGGPYHSNGHIDILATTALAQLFHGLGQPLPNLLLAIKSAKHTRLSLLLLRWPHDIMNTTPALKLLNSPASCSTARLTPSFRFIKNELQSLPHFMHISINAAITSVLHVDSYGEISRLSSLFSRATNLHNPISTFLLSIANIYTWLAYSSFDDIIDQDQSPNELMIANIFHRKALTYYDTTARSLNLQYTVHADFDDMDIANAWELTHCRFNTTDDSITVTTLPDYDDLSVLAMRSKGHILGPLLLLQAAAEGRELRQKGDQALKHYLIARQLNDDVHDWADDLSRGHISYVVCYMLKELNITPGNYSKVELTQKLKSYFWTTGLEQILTLIAYHALACKTQLTSLFASDDVAAFIELTLTPIEQSVAEASQRLKRQKDFFKSYKK